jgi:hypothetical protein
MIKALFRLSVDVPKLQGAQIQAIFRPPKAK